MNCNRGIDMAAKSCLYCNWWQTERPPMKAQPVATTSAAAPAQPERHWNRKILGAVAFVALLIIAFVIGSLVHGFEPREVKAAQQPKQTASTPAVATQAPAPPTVNIPLVPDNSAPAGPIEQPQTSLPQTYTVNGAMGGSDATAMTSQQYGAAVQQNAPPPQQVTTVDPRSVGGTVYGNNDSAPQQPRPHPQRHAAVAGARMTQPVAIDQPVPSLRGRGHAKLALIVGTDGRVHDIDVLQPMQGDMGRLIGAVQSWRFRPATQNGIPVSSRFTVDINVE